MKVKLILFLLFIGSYFFSGCASSLPTIEVSAKYPPKELKEDLDFLFQTFEEVHPNLYLFGSKKVFDSTIVSIKNKLNRPITSFEFYKLVMPNISALVDGHTWISLPYEFRKKYFSEGGKIVPFEILINENKIFVSKNYSLDSMFTSNSEIISINSIPSNELIDELSKYNSAEFEVRRKKMTQIKFTLLLWTHYGFGREVDINYISSKDNRHYTRKLLGITDTVFASASLRQKNTSLKSSYSKWSLKILDEENTAILDLNTFSHSGDLEVFNKFLDSTFSEIKNKNSRNLIIDVRDNGGGESQLGELLIDYLAVEPWVLFSKADFRLSDQIKSQMIPWYARWMPFKFFINIFSFLYTSMGIEDIVFDSDKSDLLHVYMKPKELEDNPLRYNGNIYVLINNGSFSMSVMFSAFMKDYNLATLIGEETGQSANPYGGNYFFNLPNTHLRVSVPSARSYRPSGLDTKRGVIPDFEVKQNNEDLVKGIDTIMEFTKQLIEKKSNDVSATR